MTLYEKLPESVTFRGTVYALRPSFDRVLEAYAVCKRGDFTPGEKLEYATFLLLEDGAPISPALLNAAFEVLNPGKKGPGGPKVFDFEQDAEVIYASFRAVYGIDLFRERGALHWCAFLAMFQNLPESCAFSRLIQLRTAKVPKRTAQNAAQVDALLKAKAAVRLRLTEEEEKQQFDAGLMKAFGGWLRSTEPVHSITTPGG